MQQKEQKNENPKLQRSQDSLVLQSDNQNAPAIKIRQEQIDLELDNNKNSNSLIVVDDLLCPICQHLVWLPIQCANCKLHICQSCLQEWQRSQQMQQSKKPQSQQQQLQQQQQQQNSALGNSFSCPISGCTKFVAEKAHPFFYKQLSGLKIFCANRGQGCNESLNYSVYAKHVQEECNFVFQQCSNVGCGVKVKRRDLQQHCEQECAFQVLPCKWCKQGWLRMELKVHEENVCEKAEIACGVEGCPQKLLRGQMEKHRTELCEFRVVKCKFCGKFSNFRESQEHELSLCEKRTKECFGCAENVLLSHYEEHLLSCEKAVVECQICRQKVQYKDFKNNEHEGSKACLIQAVVGLNKQNRELVEVNAKQQKDIAEINQFQAKQNTVWEERLKKVETIFNERNNKIEDLNILQKEVVKVNNAIYQVLLIEILPHIESKHETQFQGFEDLWEYIMFLKNIFVLYQGWHKFHCSPCMDFIKKYLQQLEPLIEKRKFLIKQIDQIAQSL